VQTLDEMSLEIPARLGGLRLDQALTELFPEFSRSRLQEWIKSGGVLLDGVRVPPKQRIVGGEQVRLRPERPDTGESPAQDLPLELIYADAAILIVNKPAGLVVHPAAGHHDGTLLNALLHHAPELAALPRCGIVHRLDKDTSGLLMIARTLTAHKSLVDQLQGRSVHREYLALVQGQLTGGGTIELPIGRHPVDRKRFTVSQAGKRAITHYRIEERLSHHTLIRVKLETGRTHQIRVHLTHLRHPLVGDPVYGRLRLPAGAPEPVTQTLQAFRRQALHAARLGLIHPVTAEYQEWSAPLPGDFSRLLDVLRNAA
jgi:23S rRNA pseudouridine1911/1915/1917 synthase